MQNIVEMRDSLSDNYEKLKNKEMGVMLGKELANTAGKILTSLKVEIEYNKMQGLKKKIKFLEVKD